MTPFQKQWIDQASYQELIDKVRSEPPVSDWFTDECGAYLFAALRSCVEHLVEQEVEPCDFLIQGTHQQISLRS